MLFLITMQIALSFTLYNSTLIFKRKNKSTIKKKNVRNIPNDI